MNGPGRPFVPQQYGSPAYGSPGGYGPGSTPNPGGPPFQPHGMGGSLPSRPGLGAPGAAQNPVAANAPGGVELPTNSSPGTPGTGWGARANQAQAQAAATGEKFTLFLTGIAEGVPEIGLENILNTVGPLLALRRVRDASGKPKTFGFAEYTDPQSVLRCLAVVNGIMLGSGGSEKPLTVKADEKTRAKLDQFEAGRMKTDEDEAELEKAREAVQVAVQQMRDPSWVSSATAAAAAAKGERPANTPSHLQDLAPEDLPEESRGLITREIAFFRERAIKKDAAAAAAAASQNDYGGANRRQQQNFGGNRGGPGGFNQGPQGYHAGPNAGPGQNFGGGGRQGNSFQPGGGYQNAGRGTNSEPLGGQANGFGRQGPGGAFVRPSSYSQPTDDQAAEDEETQERLRQDRKRRDAEQAFRERERRWEARERTRSTALERDRMREVNAQEEEDRRRTETLERFATFDDEMEKDKPRGDLFYVDRMRWRSQRRPARQREIEADRADAYAETQELEALKKMSEDFLSRQADMFSKMAEGKSRKTGVLLDDNTPIKLSFGAPKPTKVAPVAANPQPAPAPAVFDALAEEEEDSSKRKRELVPLSYSDDEEGEAVERTMTQEQKVERRQRKIKEIIRSIPAEKSGLWAYSVKWDLLNEEIITGKLHPFAVKKIVEYLGVQEDELVAAVIEHVRARKDAQDLVDELEPVLAEEAEEFVIKFWRMLIFETLAVEKRIKTTT